MGQEKDTVDRDGQATEAESDVHASALDEVASEVANSEAGDEQPNLRGALEDAQKRVLLAQAELENFRKRSRREMEEERRYANLPLMRDLLPVLDNFERAVAAEDASESSEGLLEGVRMVAEQLRAVLEQHNCRVIAAQDEAFDPMCHEAVLQQSSIDHARGQVISVVQTGYRLHDRVIRPAQVIVSTGASEPNE